MTRETKVGLLVGICVILLIGIIISDQLTVMHQSDPAELTDFAHDAQNSLIPPFLADRSGSTGRSPSAPSPQPRHEPVPLPAELAEPPRYSSASPTLPASQLPEPEPYRAPAQQAVTPAPQTPASQPSRTGTQRQPRFVEVGGDSQSSERVLMLNRLAEELENPAPQSVSDQAALYHTVQRGETIYQIARQYYGNGDYWRMIREANVNLVAADGTIRQGARLLIPNKAGLVQVEPTNTVRQPTRAVSSPSPAQLRTITVERGQTLSGLAAEHLGSATRWQELVDANRDQLQSARDLRAGMTLRLPADASFGQQTATAHATPSASETRYVVREGDSLSSIAGRTLGDRGQYLKLYEANRDVLRNPNALRPGMELRIPN